MNGILVATGITTTKNLGVNTTTVDNYETVGAANSFRGIYIGDGSLIFNARLDNPNGYYIGTGRNALNAGPITLGSTMTLDGAWLSCSIGEIWHITFFPMVELQALVILLINQCMMVAN